VSAPTFRIVRPINKVILLEAIKPLKVHISISLPAMPLHEPAWCLG
jgi:hypothetical protein